MHRDLSLIHILCAVGRAGAGVNNIPVDMYAEKGLVVFNAPGANANAVKELVILGMLLTTRKVVAGIEWLQSQKDSDIDIEKEVESHKSAYAGPEILNKSVGAVSYTHLDVYKRQVLLLKRKQFMK